MIDAIIFDFDGTILDTETPDFESWKAVYLEHGHELDLLTWSKCIGTNYTDWNPIDNLHDLIRQEHPKETLTQRQRKMFHEAIAGKQVQPGIQTLLTAARSSAIKTAVASSSKRNWVASHLERLELLDSFNVICTADDVQTVKPAPDLYLMALEKLGANASRTIAIEDSVNGVKAAKSAGIHCVAVPNAVTRHMDFSLADTCLTSVEEIDLWELTLQMRQSQTG